MVMSTADSSNALYTKDHAALKPFDSSSDGLRTKDGIVLVPQPSHDPEDPLACCLSPFIINSVPTEY